MTAEQNNPRVPRTIEQVTAIVRETGLREGRVEPILIAEGTQRSIVLHLGDLAEDYEDIINQMFLMGSKLAQRNDVGELRQAYFISEARMDLVPGDVGRNLPLSEDPNAQAVVVIANLTIPDEKLKTAILEMIRNGEGQLVPRHSGE